MLALRSADSVGHNLKCWSPHLVDLLLLLSEAVGVQRSPASAAHSSRELLLAPLQLPRHVLHGWEVAERGQAGRLDVPWNSLCVG